MKRLLPLAAAVAAIVAFPGVAHANVFTADADCGGMTLAMPRTEDGTVVTTTLDGRVVRTDTVTTFGAPVVFTIPSPDQSVAHTWAVTIDSRYNADQRWSESVPACVAVTTPPVPGSSTTSPATSPTTSVVPTGTTVPTAPAPSSTVVPTPRPTTTTTTVATGRLPDTGNGARLGTLAFGLLLAGAYALMMAGGRRG